MAKSSHQLTSKFVKSAPAGRWSDGGNLYLCVSDSGARRWAFIYRTSGGRQREMGLGSAGQFGVSLEDARKLAVEARRLLQFGRDPLDFRREAERDARIPTFGDYADQYIEEHKAGWRNEKHIAQWIMTMTKLAAPLRNVRVCDVTVDHVLAVLNPIWLKTPETASRTRSRIETILDAAKVRNFRTGENPARWRGNLKFLLPRQRKSEKHHAAMPYAEAPAFVAWLRRLERTSAEALELVILTAVRTTELLEASPNEFDLDKRLWTIPKERMKMDRDHLVPLSKRAVDIVCGRIKRLEPGAPYLYPGQKKGRPYSGAVFDSLLDDLGVDNATTHGFRSTFRDWSRVVAEARDDAIEISLAHMIGSQTTRAYARDQLVEERAVLMEKWARYLSRVGAKKRVAAAKPDHA